MAITKTPGYTFASGATVTPTRLNALVSSMDITLATAKILGRSTAGTGSMEEIDCTAAGRALLDDVDAAAQRSTLGLGDMALNSLDYLETTAVAVNQTGSGPGVGMVFNAPGAPSVTLTAGKWLVIGTVAARMSDVAGACGLRFCDNAGANFFGAGSAPNLTTARTEATVVGYKHVTTGTFVTFFYGIPVGGSTVNLGEATGIAYAGTITAVKIGAA